MIKHGDYLDAIVREVSNSFRRKKIILNVPIHLPLFQRDIPFEFPNPVDIREDDTISFYQGHLLLSHPEKPARIPHDNYISGVVYREGKPIFEFSSRHMRLGLPIYRKVNENEVPPAPFGGESFFQHTYLGFPFHYDFK